MKSLLVFFLLLIFLSSCQSTADISNEYIENPCKDPEYLRLKKMKFSEMTGAETEYFKNKEKECSEFSKEVDYRKTNNDILIASIAVGFLAVATLFFLLFRPH